jgi:hypothetical protein
MTRATSLRWIFFFAAGAGGAGCLLFGATPARVGVSAACGLLWLWLSRRKVESLDRETLGIPPRR